MIFSKLKGYLKEFESNVFEASTVRENALKLLKERKGKLSKFLDDLEDVKKQHYDKESELRNLL